jgi:hypothetical protein
MHLFLKSWLGRGFILVLVANQVVLESLLVGEESAKPGVGVFVKGHYKDKRDTKFSGTEDEYYSPCVVCSA